MIVILLVLVLGDDVPILSVLGRVGHNDSKHTYIIAFKRYNIPIFREKSVLNFGFVHVQNVISPSNNISEFLYSRGHKKLSYAFLYTA